VLEMASNRCHPAADHLQRGGKARRFR
jgi:hypothetical protein